MHQPDMADFEAILRDHMLRYPLMQPQDFGKLAYQSEFGPEHMVMDESAAKAFILSEWQAVGGGDVPINPEPIGNGLCRFHMTRKLYSPENAAELTSLFVRSAREHTGTREGLEIRLLQLAKLSVAGMDAWLQAYRQKGCPPMHHSDAFRNAYQPHYRVLLQPLADAFLARHDRQP